MVSILLSINLLITKESMYYLKFRLLILFSGIITVVISESSIGFIQNLFFKNIFLAILPIIFFFILYLTLFYKFKLNRLKH